MSILKYFNRIERIHRLIETSATGSCNEFADKMGLSRRQLLDDLREMKELGAPIRFCNFRNSYYYEMNWNPFASKITKEELQKILGGKHAEFLTSAVLPHSIMINLNYYDLSSLKWF